MERKTKIVRLYAIILLSAVALTSCEKYLDLKPDKSLVIASELKDLRAVLDHTSNMNFITTGVGESASDNIFVTDTDWAGLDLGMQNLYIWGDEILYDRVSDPWLSHYKSIYFANYVLETVDRLSVSEADLAERDEIRGAALFYRGYYFYGLAVTFAKTYDEHTAATDLGIPLRLTSDFNVESTRANVQQTYDQIIADLLAAADLLPMRSSHPVRPSRMGTYATLSRVFLSMRNYKLADQYAQKVLELDDSILDYNSLNASLNSPVPAFNEEVLFASGGGGMIPVSRMRIDSNLYASYEDNDLRKQVFFRANADGDYIFKGFYMGTVTSSFSGLALDEVYLNRAECQVRAGQHQAGMSTLNKMLEKRYKNGTFVPRTASTFSEALKIVLEERRKELVMRNIRWTDIKRLNKEPGNEVVLKRLLNGERIELPPNDNRYALPVPATIIERTGMPQNPR